ncbi:MAG: hypothetical protein COS71_01150 [Candidatus Moranbacteria bacterium CG06_land_8_20_14_3_00_40_12]|nr:MAG: hypothetical protein COS71_01150 [Candidatus Moranbacteria bacterium CG06_land_8_20_14_3_00_40_12]
MEFIIFIGGIVILVLVLKLQSRVQKLEQLVKSGVSERKAEPSYQSQPQQFETQQPATSKPLLDYIRQQLKGGVSKEEIKNSLIANSWQATDIEEAFNLIISSANLSQPVVVPAQTGPTLFEKFVAWLKEDWLLKLGAMLLLIGFGWLTTYAFLNNWIGPMGRIALGIIAGALFILLGWWRIKNYITQGGIFLVLGSTTILITIFAARTVYDFFTPFSALVVMFLSTAFVALASIKYNSRTLSLLSLTLAGIAPLLTKSPITDHIGLFAYLFVVTIGAIWIVALTGRRELTTAALIIISAYSAPHLLSPSSFPLVDIQKLLLFAYAFAALFFLTNTAGILKLKDKKIIPDLITAAGNGLFLLVWIMTAAQDEWKSLIIAAWMVIFAVGAFLIFKIAQRREPFYVYAGVGIAMLAAATSAELKGATLAIAYTIESGIIALIAYTILRDIKIAEKISLLLIGPVILSISSIASRAWATSVIHKDFFVILILGLTFLGLGAFFLRRVREIENKEPRQLNTILLIVGSIYIYVLLWLSLRAEFRNDNTAVMISLVVYTIVGLISYFYGLTNERKSLRLYGGALVGFVVGRLLLVDVWKMELAGRIVTFFLIGTLLVSTAFWGRKKRDKAMSNNI